MAEGQRPGNEADVRAQGSEWLFRLRCISTYRTGESAQLTQREGRNCRRMNEGLGDVARLGMRSSTARQWLALASATCREVLLHHTGRDAPALANRQAVLFRPEGISIERWRLARGPPGAARLRPRA